MLLELRERYSPTFIFSWIFLRKQDIGLLGNLYVELWFFAYSMFSIVWWLVNNSIYALQLRVHLWCLDMSPMYLDWDSCIGLIIFFESLAYCRPIWIVKQSNNMSISNCQVLDMGRHLEEREELKLHAWLHCWKSQILHFLTFVYLTVSQGWQHLII